MPMSCSTCAHGKAPYTDCGLPELAAYVAETGSESFCARWTSARPLDATAYPHAAPSIIGEDFPFREIPEPNGGWNIRYKGGI